MPNAVPPFPGKDLAAYIVSERGRRAIGLALDSNLRAQVRTGRVMIRGQVDTDALLGSVIEVLVEQLIAEHPYNPLE